MLLCNTSAVAGCFQLSPSGGLFGSSEGDTNLGPLQLADISINCDAEYLIGLDGGQNLLGTRRLFDGKGNYISYYLWTDGGTGTEWGNNGLEGIPYPANPLAGNGSGVEISHKIYATALTGGGITTGDIW